MRGSKDAMVRSQKGGMVQKRVGPSGRGGQTLREERREKRVERERERDTNTIKMRGSQEAMVR